MSVVLDDVATIGRFFEAQTHEVGALAPRPWHPMSELTRDTPHLMARIGGVRVALAESVGCSPGAVELRVAASVTHLGLAARLLSPALGAALTAGTVPELALDTVWWQPLLGGPFPLSLPASDYRTTQTAHTLLQGPIRELTEAVCDAVSVSTRVLWGNVASAINSAITMIGTQRPALGQRASAFAADLIEHPPLSGTATVSGTRFRRRSCCLIYRLTPRTTVSVCGDCILGA
jgi:hypothetical protein